VPSSELWGVERSCKDMQTAMKGKARWVGVVARGGLTALWVRLCKLPESSWSWLEEKGDDVPAFCQEAFLNYCPLTLSLLRCRLLCWCHGPLSASVGEGRTRSWEPAWGWWHLYCVRGAAPEPAWASRLPGAWLAEQREAVKGETLAIAILAENRTRQVSSPSAFPQPSFAQRQGPGLTLAWQTCLLLLPQLGSERGRLPGLAAAFPIIWRHLFCHSDSV